MEEKKNKIDRIFKYGLGWGILLSTATLEEYYLFMPPFFFFSPHGISDDEPPPPVPT